MKNVKYKTTVSAAAPSWETRGQGDTYELVPPDPAYPKDDGNWVLLGPGTALTRNGYCYIVWTWADLGSMSKAAVQFGAEVAGHPDFDADLVIPGSDNAPTEPPPADMPDLPVAQEGDHRCGVHNSGGYQCEFAAHDGIMHYNKACGTFVTQLPSSNPAEETETEPIL